MKKLRFGGGRGFGGGDGEFGVSGFVAERLIFAVGIEGEIGIGPEGIGGDRSGVEGAIENPPRAGAAPEDPSVTDAVPAMDFADDKASGGILELVAEPEGFVFAVAELAGGGGFWRGWGVSGGVTVAEGVALAEEGGDAGEWGWGIVHGLEDLFDDAHVGFVGGTLDRETEVDGGESERGE
jgi:hypothetical protein